MDLPVLAFLAVLVSSFHFAHSSLQKRWEPSGCSTSQAKTALSQTGSCCGALSLFLDTEVSYPGNVTYNASLASYWSLTEADITPTCIVSPKTSEDVSMTVFILAIGGTIFPGDCQFAVRSGGHAPGPGLANLEAPGITIDLKAINQLELSDDQSLINIGPGNRWVNVYEYLDPMNLSTSGGRVSSVGVGGLTLGGGISFFSPRYGSVCDNVLNFEVVLASGEIVNANATSNPDLTKALRGGSNNFGIVTAMYMRVFPQGEFWGGFLGTNISALYDMFAAFEEFAGDPDYDVYAAFINSYVWLPTYNEWEISSNLEYTKPVVNPPYFHNITSLPTTFSTMRIANMTNLSSELAEYTPPGRRDIFATATFQNSKEMMATLFELANATAQPLQSIVNVSFSISFQPQPQAIIQASLKSNSAGDSLGLTAADGTLFNLLMTVSWDDPVDDALVESQVKGFIAEAKAASEQMGKANGYIYLNYAATWQDPIDGYGATVKSELQAVSEKYDPTGVFQKQVPGGFKLFSG